MGILVLLERGSSERELYVRRRRGLYERRNDGELYERRRNE